MWRVVLIILIFPTVVGLFVMDSFFRRLKKQAASQPVTVQQQLEKYAETRRKTDQQRAPSTAPANVDVSVMIPPPKAVRPEDVPTTVAEAPKVEHKIFYDYTPLSDDLQGGARNYVDHFLERLKRVEKLKDLDERKQIINFLEFQLFLLSTDRLLSENLFTWSKKEIEKLKGRLEPKGVEKAKAL